MLRITTHENDDSLTLKVEGKLVGPWVGVLSDCWQHEASHAHGQIVRVDLRGVTLVDARGKRLLEEMSAQNAQLFADDCHMKAIVAEIETHAANLNENPTSFNQKEMLS